MRVFGNGSIQHRKGSQMKAMTIDEAIAVLTEAREKMGGDRCLILSLTDSEIDDADINSMVVQQDGESAYVEVRCDHPVAKRMVGYAFGNWPPATRQTYGGKGKSK
jgi:hypothetical protein